MKQKFTADSFVFYFKRLVTIVRKGGIIALSKRLLNLLKPCILQTHLIVLVHYAPQKSLFEISEHDDSDLSDRRNVLLKRKVCSLEFAKITENDTVDIDYLTKIDEWKIPKAVTLKMLREGWVCYVAKKGNEIVATGWASLADIFIDTHLKREFVLSQDEAYCWRGFSVPAHRGKGIMPRLIEHLTADLLISHGKSKLFILVRYDNDIIMKTVVKVGWRKIGRAGFIEAYGIRFHYLIGGDAFSQTKKRLFFNRTNKSII